MHRNDLDVRKILELAWVRCDTGDPRGFFPTPVPADDTQPGNPNKTPKLIYLV